VAAVPTDEGLERPAIEMDRRLQELVGDAHQ
jgi:hypothetical protein